MSYSTTQDTITVKGITYDVERDDHGSHTTLTIEDFPGLEGRIGYDEFAPEHANPREWCNVGTMLVNYRGYTLGDGENDDEFLLPCNVCTGHGTVEVEGPQTEGDAAYWRGIVDYTCERCGGDGSIEVDPATYYRETRGARVVMPLYVYEHSGITMSAGTPIEAQLTREDVRSTGRFVGDDAGWDTSFVGFVFDTPEQVEQCIGKDATDEQIAKAMDSEVEVYASYLEGDVTEYSVDDDETGYVDSCGGFVGDSDECERQCFDSMESAIVKRLAELDERAAMAARDIVTV